ncbi:ATP-dependent endonuclease [Pseudofulvibacter geojedonensis]|uniref:ATP-dependent endonuclease n=1 Tax=Pseudofulvibacter geojedonensis TaxID=1123758 RepID=A0ABW3I0A9_9FLAO
MKLENITIRNYRSIEEIEVAIEEINGSYTYSLLGINESGKSSFLKAVSLYDNEDISYPLDYFDQSKPVEVVLTYTPDEDKIDEIKSTLRDDYNFDELVLSQIKINKVDIIVQFSNDSSTIKTQLEDVTFENSLFENYSMNGLLLVKDDESVTDSTEPLNLNTFFKNNLSTTFWDSSHTVVFWKSSPEYLLLDEIDLNSFASSPDKVSVPLFNCFRLAGIKSSNIESEIRKLNTPVAISSLQSKLSELTTKHINSVWPEHPISVLFQINNNKISLLIEDNDVKYKPKTTGQRSDGFKQFISFLLTVSVENYNDSLRNKILLIDEPETHLHPPAQINLLKEMIKITSNSNNNILFFATHSNYLIDKFNLNRNFKLSKKKNLKTVINKIEQKITTYSEVNYEVFDILTTDYHNELFGFIESESPDKLDALDKKKTWINAKTQKTYNTSLSRYIRDSIHHPENQLNKPFTEKELKTSIEILRGLRDEIVKSNLAVVAN